MKRNERENKENAVRLIVHSITHRGEIWRGEGGGAWSEGIAGGEGGGGSVVSTYKRDGWDGMTIHKFSNSYYIKKGLLLTVIQFRGIAETSRCGAVAVRSQVITWSSTLTLYALYLSRPHPHTPAPPLLSQARSLIATLVHSYTCYTGVSQNNFLWQKYLASNFWKISPIFFFFAAWHPCIFATPFAEKCAPFFTTR